MYWVSAQTAAGVSNEMMSDHSVSQASSNSIIQSPVSESKLTETIEPTQKIELPKMPNTADQLLDVTLALALVVGLIYGAAWLVKRNKGLAPSTGIPMKTLSVLPMGVKEKIILIEVGGKQILLGMTPQQINTLATFDEPIVDASLSEQQSFSTRLKQMLNQNNHTDSKE